MQTNSPYWFIALGFLPVLLIGVVTHVRKNRDKARLILFSCVGLGVLLVAAYSAYAFLKYGLDPVDVALGKTEANQVKNLWGKKNFIYLIPFGYLFVLIGLILMPIFWRKKSRKESRESRDSIPNF